MHMEIQILETLMVGGNNIRNSNLTYLRGLEIAELKEQTTMV